MCYRIYIYIYIDDAKGREIVVTLMPKNTFKIFEHKGATMTPVIRIYLTDNKKPAYLVFKEHLTIYHICISHGMQLDKF